MGIFQEKSINNLSWFRKKPLEKIKPKDQAPFLMTLFELLEEGFSLAQAISFMEFLLPDYRQVFKHFEEILSQGRGLETGLKAAGFPLGIVAQIYYGQKQGRFLPALKKAADQLFLQEEYRRKMIKQVTYPSVMFIFLLALLFGMRTFLLPHITSFISQETYDKNVMVQVLVNFFTYLPQISLITFAMGLVLYLIIDLYLLRLTPIQRSRILLRIPLVRKWTRFYCTFKVAQMVGYFMQGGYSLRQTFDFVVTYPIDPFLTSLATAVNQQLLEGEEFGKALDDLEIFNSEFTMVIYQGEITSQLATKAIKYADSIWKRMMDDIAKKITMLQPMMFCLIAVLVMAMYLLMMLPMLTMEGF